jgi:signal transduction histidine kinase
MKKLFKLLLKPRKSVRFSLPRLYIISLIILALVLTSGYFTISELIREIEVDQALFYRVSHQLTHTPALKEYINTINRRQLSGGTFKDKEEAECFDIYIAAMQNNHQLIIGDFAREKGHFGFDLENYLQLKIGIAEIYFHHTKLLLKRLQTQKKWNAADAENAVTSLGNYDGVLHDIVHYYFEDHRNDFSRLIYWFTISIITIFFIVGMVVTFFVVIPAMKYLSNYLRDSLHNQRKLNQANRELNRTNKELEHTYQLLKMEQQKSIDALKTNYETEINQQKTNTHFLVLGQEKERERIARELHDSIGQMLTGIKYGLEKLQSQQKTPQLAEVKNIDELLELTNLTIEESRRILVALLPATLEAYGIDSAIKSFIGTLQKQYPTIHFNFFSSVPISIITSKWVALGIYRITQEILSNAVKHARATEILIELDQDTTNLLLRISDNGNGFEPNSLLTLPTQFGIENMFRRAEILGAKFQIESSLGQGTEVQLSIPNEFLMRDGVTFDLSDLSYKWPVS